MIEICRVLKRELADVSSVYTGLLDTSQQWIFIIPDLLDVPDVGLLHCKSTTSSSNTILDFCVTGAGLRHDEK